MADTDGEVTVSHSDTSVLPIPAPDFGYGSTIHTTTVTDAQGTQYEGNGWTEGEANDAAGKAMNEGKGDGEGNGDGDGEGDGE